jgi:hypothetical protein
MTAPATVAHDTGVFDLDDEAYFTSPLARASLSSTGARELLKPGGPARFRHHMDAGTLEVRREFDVGHAVHTLVLGAGPSPSRSSAPARAARTRGRTRPTKTWWRRPAPPAGCRCARPTWRPPRRWRPPFGRTRSLRSCSPPVSRSGR